MRESQNSRPAASVELSETEELQTQTKKVAMLERDFAALPKDADDRLQSLRTQLCEIFSNVICTDPSFALQSACPARMWRQCFHSRFSVVRQKIAKNKRERAASVAVTEKSLKKSIREAVRLYTYLTEKMMSYLPVSNSQRSLSDPMQQHPKPSSPPSRDRDPIVQMLHQLFIYLGDLHRYDNVLSKAESSYLDASRLAPGMGNPYNQLAVVAQMKQNVMTCDSLYWYTRSLMATHGSFGTAADNLRKLFQMNRRRLREHSRSRFPPVFDRKPRQKESLQDFKERRAPVSKAFLIHFVDLHFDIFQGHVAATIERTEPILRCLASLLASSAYSDQLLCKMATIAIFSAERELEKQRNNQQLQVRDNPTVATDLLLQLATCYLQQLHVSISKHSNSIDTSRPTTVRYLAPTLVLLLYIEVARLDKTGLLPKQTEFWQPIVDIGNLLVRKPRPDTPSTFPSTEGMMKELRNLKGFKPMQRLHPQYSESAGYVSQSDASDVLGLSAIDGTKNGPKQISETDKGIEASLAFCHRMADNALAPIEMQDGTFVVSVLAAEIPPSDTSSAAAALAPVTVNPYTDSKAVKHPTVTVGEVRTNGIHQSNTASGSLRTFQKDASSDEGTPIGDDDAGDRVTFQAEPAPERDARTTAPARIRPVSRLHSRIHGAADDTEDNYSSRGKSSATSGHLSSRVKPPPGFGPPLLNPTDRTVPSTVEGQSMELCDVANPRETYGASNGQVVSMMTSYPGQSHRSAAQPNMIDWFGQPVAVNTRNPFVSIPAAATTNSAVHDFGATTNDPLGAADLLGPGLLSSLGSEDNRTQKPTRNPFAEF